MSGATRVLVAVHDETKPTETRVDTFCGACGAQIGRFDLECRECGEKAARECEWREEPCE